jgi:hypothetical protein
MAAFVALDHVLHSALETSRAAPGSMTSIGKRQPRGRCERIDFECGSPRDSPVTSTPSDVLTRRGRRMGERRNSNMARLTPIS